MTLTINTGRRFSQLNEQDFISDSDVTVTSKTPKLVTIKCGDTTYALKESIYANARAVQKLIVVDLETQVRTLVPSDSMFDHVSTALDEKKNSSGVTILDDSQLPTVHGTKLKDIQFDPKLFVPIETNTYLDTFWSFKGGIIPGTNTMVIGDPGVGKSSNLMDILCNIHMNSKNTRVLYISAEMNDVDVKEFEQYYPTISDIEFFYISEYVTDDSIGIPANIALRSILNQGWDVVVMDSFIEIQSIIQEELQLPYKKAEKWILDLLKKHNAGFNVNKCYTAFLAIQQMSKSGTYVGSKRLEHMTTAFLKLCWEGTSRRYMVFDKNRKGKEKVRLYYGFKPDGGIEYDEAKHASELLIARNLGTSTDESIANEFESFFESFKSGDASEQIKSF